MATTLNMKSTIYGDLCKLYLKGAKRGRLAQLERSDGRLGKARFTLILPHQVHFFLISFFYALPARSRSSVL